MDVNLAGRELAVLEVINIIINYDMYSYLKDMRISKIMLTAQRELPYVEHCRQSNFLR